MAKSKAGSSASRAAAAAADESGHSFGPGDIVMAKVKGYPAWPGVICDEKNVPSKVRAQKTIKSAFTVRFFPHADYNWFKARDMTLLTQREIRAYLDDPHKKQADLRQAYKVALDPHAWVQEQDEIVAAAERAAEDEEEGVDELDGEEADEDDVRPAKGGKRKRASEEKGGKVRESADTKAKKKKKLEAAEPKKSAAKASEERGTSAAARKTEDEADGQDPEMKRVYGWRHALQRGFLPKDGKIKEEDMPTHDKTFSAVEAHKSMTEEQLKETKIGKVMKRIAGLADVPRDADFDFTGRAAALCNTWGEVMAGAAAPAAAAARATSAKQEGSSSSSSKHDSSEAAASSDAKEAPSQDASKPAAAATNGSAAAPSSSSDDAPDAAAAPADAAPAAEASANSDAPSSEAAAAAPSNGDAAPASVGQDD